MKKIIFVVVLLSLFGCRNINKQPQLLTDKEWSDILNITLPLAKGDKPYIYRKFENVESKEIISSVYTNCEDIGYELNDTILNYINSRNNKLITNKLDTMFNVSFVSNLNGFKHNYVIYSEPFYVNNQILCISMSNKIIKEDALLKWVFFLKKQNDSIKVIEFYDVQKDMFFEPAPL